MNSVRFDLESDGRFLDSLRDLGGQMAQRVIETLSRMSGTVSWREMMDDYLWREIPISPIDSYPGAHRYYSFILYYSAADIIEIVALHYAPPDVVCVLARASKLQA